MTTPPGPPPWPIPPSWTPETVPPPPPAPDVPTLYPAQPPRATVAVLGLADPPACPGIRVEAHDLPATQTFADLYELADAVDKSLASGADGVVVVPGTDAIEETSWALDLLYTGDRPVAVTSENGLAAALRVAADGPDDLGVVVVAHDEIHSPRYVRALGGGRFGSPGAGPLGSTADDRLRLLWRPPERITVPAGTGTPRVVCYPALLGDDGTALRTMGPVCDGLVVSASGSVPEPLEPILVELSARIPVVLAMFHGRRPSPIPITDLAPAKARMLMRLLLATGEDRAAVLTALGSAGTGPHGD